MKKLFLFLLLLISFDGFSQINGCPCMWDSIVSMNKDTFNVKDTLVIQTWFQGGVGSDYLNDSVFIQAYINSQFYFSQLLATQTSLFDSFHPNDDGIITTKIVIPDNPKLYSPYTKVMLVFYDNSGYQSFGDNQSSNHMPRYIYIKDYVAGLPTTSLQNNRIIKEVRYYTITGQLYGIFPQQQIRLPQIPLIEETIYNDNEVSARRLLHIY